MKTHAGWGVVLLAVAATSWVSCADEPTGSVAQPIAEARGGRDGFTAAEWARVRALSPLPAPPVDTTNRYADSPAAAALGHRLFFDRRLAGPIQAGTRAEGQLGAVGQAERIACSDCHMPSSRWLFDVRSNNGGPIPNATALGSAWMTRNVSSLVNTAFYVKAPGGRGAPHWRENDGYSDSEWFDAQSEPEGAPVQNGSRLQLAHVIFDHYRADYDAAFPEWPLDPGLADRARFPATGLPGQPGYDAMAPGDQEVVNRVLANYGKAIEAYLRTLVSRDAPFDRYVAGDRHAISAQARRGLALFVGRAGCVSCHNGPLLSDDDFHTIGLHVDTARSPHADPNEVGRAANVSFILDSPFNVNGPYSDDRTTGRLDGVTRGDPAYVGQWRTKGLRQVAETGPYMHTGQFATLDEVVEFYNRGGDPRGTYVGGPSELRPLRLSCEERIALVEFLGTLTGRPLPPALVADTHRP